mgnify:CR=1 FL=1
MKQEKIKELIKTFLKPDWKRIALFFWVMILCSIPECSPIIFNGIFCTTGRPFPYYISEEPSSFFSYLSSGEKFYFYNLVYNIIIWYLISCSIAFTLENLYKKYPLSKIEPLAKPVTWTFFMVIFVISCAIATQAGIAYFIGQHPFYSPPQGVKDVKDYGPLVMGIGYTIGLIAFSISALVFKNVKNLINLIAYFLIALGLSAFVILFIFPSIEGAAINPSFIFPESFIGIFGISVGFFLSFKRR